MTFTSDQKPDGEGLSAHSRQLHALREPVLAEWERRLRASLEQARALDHPLLINTLPVFYDNIAQALTPDYPRTTGSDGTTLASEHGGERARLTGYDHQALIMEYQLFRSVIFDLLDGEGIALSAREVATINTSIDAAIMEAAHGFVLVQNRLREQFSAALAHDLRRPLGVTSAALELMLMTNDPAKMKPLAARALDNVHRMDRMIHELLDTMSFHRACEKPPGQGAPAKTVHSYGETVQHSHGGFFHTLIAARGWRWSCRTSISARSCAKSSWGRPAPPARKRTCN